ncbi:MAG: hypothetical protein IKK89_02760 [Alistipes sp.]|nr:hypothetical protein [Alistipes sp.]
MGELIRRNKYSIVNNSYKDMGLLYENGRPRNIWDAKQLVIFKRIDDLYISQNLKASMKTGITNVLEMGISCMKARYSFRLVMKVVDEKCLRILNAKTEYEATRASVLSFPHFTDNGFVVTGRYHIPEEELLLLSAARRVGTLTIPAQRRFDELYQYHMSAKIDEVD